MYRHCSPPCYLYWTKGRNVCDQTGNKWHSDQPGIQEHSKFPVKGFKMVQNESFHLGYKKSLHLHQSLFTGEAASNRSFCSNLGPLTSFWCCCCLSFPLLCSLLSWSRKASDFKVKPYNSGIFWPADAPVPLQSRAVARKLLQSISFFQDHCLLQG